MEPSIPGLLLVLALLALGYQLGAPVTVGLLVSLAFGSTALGTMGALGGSSPLIYVAFGLLLLAGVTLRRGCADRLAYILSFHATARVVVALMVCAVAGTMLLPRLFLGQTTVPVPTPEGVKELLLAPTSANITQTGYFVLGALTYFAFAVSLVEKGRLDAVRRGFLAWAVVHAGLGIVDLAGKLAGAGDLLSPIRTATYAYLVEVEEAGFWRIAGGFSEASAFGSATLSCLAFSFAYWRISRSRPVLLLALALLVLLLLSTSATAYAGFAIVASVAAAAMALSALRGRFSSQDLLVLVLVWLALTVALSLYLLDERLFDPFVDLFETVVINKSLSESGLERHYWNVQSLQALIDTYGLGVGVGSSRASSWPVAVGSQLGIVGALLMAGLVGALLRNPLSPQPRGSDRQTPALVAGVRAAALASLAGASVSGGSADPGLVFFIALAVVGACRRGEPAATVRREPAVAANRAAAARIAWVHVGRETVGRLNAAARRPGAARGAAST